MFISMNLYIYTLNISIYMYTYICIHVCIYVYMYVYMHVYIYIHTYLYTYIYTHTYLFMFLVLHHILTSHFGCSKMWMYTTYLFHIYKLNSMTRESQPASVHSLQPTQYRFQCVAVCCSVLQCVAVSVQRPFAIPTTHECIGLLAHEFIYH